MPMFGSKSANPGGADTQVQFNDGGAFAGDSGLTFNKTTKALNVAGLVNLGAQADVAIARAAAGVVEVNTGTAGQLRDLNLRKLTAASGVDTLTIEPMGYYSRIVTNWGLLVSATEVNAPPLGVLGSIGSTESNDWLLLDKHTILFPKGLPGTYTARIKFGTCYMDQQAASLSISAQNALAAATVNLTGGSLNIAGGDGAAGSAGAANGGALHLDGGRGYGSGVHGDVYVGNTRGNLRVMGLTMPAQYTNATEPSFVNGAVIFNTDLDKLRIGGAAAWETVTSA